MKRYLVFAWDDYYPAGGWGDFVGAFDDLDAAKACAAQCTSVEGWRGEGHREGRHYDGSEVIDLQTLREVA
jgi:hypothetical protein